MATEGLRAEEVPLRSPEFTSAPVFSNAGGMGRDEGAQGESVSAKLKGLAYGAFKSTKGFMASTTWLLFFDVRQVALPKSAYDAMDRTRKNWGRFRPNYVILVVSYVFFRMLFGSFYSFMVLVSLACLWGWVLWLRPNANTNMKIGSREYTPIDQKIILAITSFLMVFFFSNAASAIFSSLLMGAVATVLHGALFKPGQEDAFQSGDLEAGGSSTTSATADFGIQLSNAFTSTMAAATASSAK
mmetsp:Transcript_6113/g.14848  ORF Transcript_6113/g.14848 Transcript_6113/m.14848 type:complete len:243 (-) Transcript_6113:1329-2057(-)